MKHIIASIVFMHCNLCLGYERGLTNHFINWLNDVGGYEPYNFNRSDFFGGSFGGKDDDDTPIVRRPVVFVHGTAARIIGNDPNTDGFR